MRIAFIGIKSLPAKAGADHCVEAVVRIIEDAECTVYCSAQITPEGATFPKAKLIRIPCPKGKYTHMTTLDLLAALHALFFGNYDLIHLINIEASFILPILRLRFPVIATAQGRMTEGNRWGKIALSLLRSMEWPFMNLSNVRTSASLKDARDLEKQFGRRVEYIPNGIDLHAVVDEERARKILMENQIPTENLLVFAAARIIPLKGLHILLEALQRRSHPVNLVCIGRTDVDTAYMESLRKWSNPQVHFLPLQPSPILFGFISLASLFVFPSFHEGMSMTLLEAASLGVPILCSDIPANQNVLGNNGLYFRTGDVNHLSDQLTWALEHPREEAERAELTRVYVRSTFDSAAIVQRYSDLYKACIMAKY